MPIFYSALMLTGVNLLLRMVSTSFQVFISSRIGAAGVGLLQLVLSVGSLAMTAGIGGIRTATMYLTAEELGRKRPGNVIWVLSGAVLYSIVCSSVVGGSLYWFAPKIAEYWIRDLTAAPAIRLLGALLPVSCLTGVMTGYFTAANRIGTLAVVEIAEQLCSMAVTAGLLVFWADPDPGNACLAVVLGSSSGACLTLLSLVFLRLREQSPAPKKIPIGRHLTATAVPLALADDLKAGISTTENLMVPRRLALFSGTDNPLALFGTVCGMVFPVLMFPAAILFGLTELLIPELARCNAAGSKARIRYLARRSLRLALLYGCLSGSILFLISKPLCLRLYDSPDAGRFLKWFAPLTAMLYCDIVTDSMIKGLGQQRASVRYNIITSAMDLVLLFLLLPRYGMGGYFFSFAVTHVINFFLSLKRLLKITGQKIPLYPTVMTIAAAVGAVAMAQTLKLPVLQIIGFLGLFGSLLVLLRVVRKEDLFWLLGLVRGKTQ